MWKKLALGFCVLSALLASVASAEITSVEGARQEMQDHSDYMTQFMSDMKPGDPRLFFGACQECILKVLLKMYDHPEQYGVGEQDLIWLGNIVHDFMGSFRLAYSGQLYELTRGRRPRTGDPEFARMVRGEVSGYWYSSLFPRINGPAFRLATLFLPKEMVYGYFLMHRHIEGDLRVALYNHGYGSDGMWNKVGDAVRQCTDSTVIDLKRKGYLWISPWPKTALSSIFEVLGGYRVSWIRDRVRKEVRANVDRRGGGPYQGVAMRANDIRFRHHGFCGGLFSMLKLGPGYL